MSSTQENTVDLHSVGRVLLTFASTVGGKHIQPVKNTSLLALYDRLSTGHHLLGVVFITSLKSNLCTALTTRYTTGHYSTNSHAQNTTALQSNVFSSRILGTGHKCKDGVL